MTQSLIVAKMAVILSGLATSNEGDAYYLLFTASPQGLNSKRIYNYRWRKPCQLPGWIKNSPYYIVCHSCDSNLRPPAQHDHE